MQVPVQSGTRPSQDCLCQACLCSSSACPTSDPRRFAYLTTCPNLKKGSCPIRTALLRVRWSSFMTDASTWVNLPRKAELTTAVLTDAILSAVSASEALNRRACSCSAERPASAMLDPSSSAPRKNTDRGAATGLHLLTGHHHPGKHWTPGGDPD